MLIIMTNTHLNLYLQCCLTIIFKYNVIEEEKKEVFLSLLEMTCHGLGPFLYSYTHIYTYIYIKNKQRRIRTTFCKSGLKIALLYPTGFLNIFRDTNVETSKFTNNKYMYNHNA